MDNVPVQIYFKDLESRFIRINTAQAKLFSLSDPNQAVGKTDFDFFLSEHAQRAFDDEQKIIQTGLPLTKLEKETWEGFADTWVTTTKLPLRDKDEKIIGTFGISIDVTDLKHKEDLLEEDRNLLSTLIENLPDSVYVKNRSGTIIVDNIAHRHMLGATSLEQVVGKTDFDFFPKERAASYRASEEQVIQSGESLIDKEEPYIDHNGDQRWLSTTKVPLRDSDGKVTGIVGINHDITQRKHAIDAVFNSEKQLKETQIIAGLGNYRFDFSAGTWESSDVLDVIFGIDETFERSIEGWAEIIHPTDRQQMTDYLANEVIGKHTHFDKEYRIVRIKDGVERWVHGLGELEFDAQNKLTVMLGTIRDITERKQAELMIEAHLQLVDFAMHHSLDEVLVKTLDEICDLTGSPIGFYHFIEPDQVTLSLQAWSTRTTQEYCKAEGKGSHYNIDQAGVWVECFHQRQPVIHNDYASLPTSRRKGLPEGHAELVRELAVPIMRNDLVVAILGIGNKTQNYTEKDIEIATYFADVVWEIVERKRTEQQLAKHTEHLEELVDERTRELRETQQQLVRQERLATMGQLAGSIGHELRNPLGVITNAVYYLKMAEPNANDKVKEYLDIIEKEARTSDKIITDLLDFTRIKALDRQPASVSELIHQTFERYYAPESVNVELEIPAALPQIYADPLHVVQILINLVSNACQSMSPADTANEVSNVGKLTVTASILGDMIKIDVQDTGTGILPENMKKIFEPLFTTKTKGIGLGLAVSQKLAEANGGRIEVQSEAGKGSIFSVYFPKYRQESQ